jgi:hypothetical protein
VINRHQIIAGQRRLHLIALCAAQRDELGSLMARMEGPLKVADRGLSVLRYVRERPVVIGALAALFAATRGRGTWKWAQRGVLAWRAWRTLAR